MNAQKDWAALVGRILLSILFIISGFEKISGFEGTAASIAGHGLPFSQVLAAGAIVIELGGGLAVLAGWKTRWVALALIVFMIVITPIFHNFWSAPPAQAMNQQINFMKNVSILGGIFLLLAFGPGRYSLDRA
ncbi:MAG TPA: DoxX family protein [Casimicrobiaceae bacterium]|nr:DoxX family protein [Casimicrobiaceae bacterium]